MQIRVKQDGRPSQGTNIMQKQFPVSRAENNSSAIIQDVEHGSEVQFTKYGKPVAVLVSYAQYQGLIHQKNDFWSALSTQAIVFGHELKQN
ncbi:type II toxin-antitoxin system prevent-host-death family antitoxin [bacterium]|nr:type II toxin-antitoxin system prevent-host-death family antitoxin [bacterium]